MPLKKSDVVAPYGWGDWMGSQLRASTPLRLQLTGALFDMAFWNARLATELGALALAPWQTPVAAIRTVDARNKGGTDQMNESTTVDAGPLKEFRMPE